MPKTATKKFKQELRQRAGGTCECRGRSCSHHPPGRRCGTRLVSPHWQAHRKRVGGTYTLSSTVAMCKRCHVNTRSYGRTQS